MSDDEFTTFWAAYPRRVAKADARKAWAKARQTTPDLLTRCLDALAWQIHQPQWTKDDGAFVPYPASWLRAERWDDESPQAARAAKAAVQSVADAEYRAMRERVIAEQDARARALSGRG